MSHLYNFLSPKEIAHKLGLHVCTVQNWLRAGKLRGVRLVGSWRVNPEDLSKFIERQYNDYKGE